MEKVKKEIELLEEKLEALQMEYYKTVFAKVVELCKKFDCHFDTNGGCTFFSNDGEDPIEDNEELSEMKELLYKYEGRFGGIPTIWYDKNEFSGDHNEVFNGCLDTHIGNKAIDIKQNTPVHKWCYLCKTPALCKVQNICTIKTQKP